ncbi:hypothetical protein GTO27_11365 [Candidatus Bathyarchaeota archaeon]|nr:hypothetical protein [Candidatus Bathyarchaeota archaeon]
MNQDVKDVIITILSVVGWEADQIASLAKDYKVPVKLRSIMSQICGAGLHSIRSLFNDVLENLDVKGLYVLSDFDINLDENHMWLSYAALINCNLLIDGFYVTLEPGLKGLTTNTYIETEKVNKKALGKLKELIKTVEIPDEFSDLDHYAFEIEEDEENWTFTIDFSAESLTHLPSVKRISEFVEQILRKVGITR